MAQCAAALQTARACKTLHGWGIQLETPNCRGIAHSTAPASLLLTCRNTVLLDGCFCRALWGKLRKTLITSQRHTIRACIYLQKVFIASCRAFPPNNKKMLPSQEKLFIVWFLYQGTPINTTQMEGPCAIKPWMTNVHSFSLSDTTDFLPSMHGFAVF